MFPGLRMREKREGSGIREGRRKGEERVELTTSFPAPAPPPPSPPPFWTSLEDPACSFDELDSPPTVVSESSNRKGSEDVDREGEGTSSSPLRRTFFLARCNPKKPRRH